WGGSWGGPARARAATTMPASAAPPPPTAASQTFDDLRPALRFGRIAETGSWGVKSSHTLEVRDTPAAWIPFDRIAGAGASPTNASTGAAFALIGETRLTPAPAPKKAVTSSSWAALSGSG